MHDLVTVLVMEEGMCKIKTLSARTGKTYRSSDCVLVRTGPVLEFETQCSGKSRTCTQVVSPSYSVDRIYVKG